MKINTDTYKNLAASVLFSSALFGAHTVSAQTAFTGTDWSQFPGGVEAVCKNSDIDEDDDGLIELCALEDVSAMRHVLDGSGYKASASATTRTAGCPSTGCKGYELVRDLDFTDDESYRSAETNQTSWTTGAGFLPVGDTDNTFKAIFEGNGYTLSNLRIVRPTMDYASLFGRLSSDAHINGLGIVNAKVEGNGAVGSFAGESKGTISNSYSSGSIQGEGAIGGLVGSNTSTITSSYNTASVNGNENVGGLTSWNRGTIINSYNTGRINGGVVGIAAGLVGIEQAGTIKNSYNTGLASSINTSNPILGSLVAQDFGAGSRVENSYSSVQTIDLIAQLSRTPSVAQIKIINSKKVTAAELTSPTGPTGIFSTWSSVAWYFGTNTEYPALRYSTGTNANYLACGESQQPTCGNLLGGQGRRVIAILDTSNVRIEAVEGETLTLDATRAGATNYQWQYTGSAKLPLPTPDAPRLRLSIPPNLVMSGATTGALAFRLKVGTASTQTIQIIAYNVDNGTAEPRIGKKGNQLTVTNLASDPDGAGMVIGTYQWQRCNSTATVCPNWTTLSETGQSYEVTDPDTDDKRQFQASFTYRDEQGYTATVTTLPFTFRKSIRVRIKVYLEGPLER